MRFDEIIICRDFLNFSFFTGLGFELSYHKLRKKYGNI